MYLDDVLKTQKDNEAQARDISMTAALWSSMYVPSSAVITSIFLANAIDLCNRAASESKLPDMAKNYLENAAISAGIALAPVLLGSIIMVAFLNARRSYLRQNMYGA